MLTLKILGLKTYFLYTKPTMAKGQVPNFKTQDFVANKNETQKLENQLADQGFKKV